MTSFREKILAKYPNLDQIPYLFGHYLFTSKDLELDFLLEFIELYRKDIATTSLRVEKDNNPVGEMHLLKDILRLQNNGAVKEMLIFVFNTNKTKQLFEFQNSSSNLPKLTFMGAPICTSDQVGKNEIVAVVRPKFDCMNGCKLITIGTYE